MIRFIINSRPRFYAAGWHGLCPCLSELDAELTSVNLVDLIESPLRESVNVGNFQKLSFGRISFEKRCLMNANRRLISGSRTVG